MSGKHQIDLNTDILVYMHFEFNINALWSHYYKFIMNLKFHMFMQQRKIFLSNKIVCIGFIS